MVNRLSECTSPYLLQHQHNPVDWFPWCPEAFERAREQDKPMFLSIGYAACHWCHVMEHESFENEEIASILNQHFVSIKVDREERPDLDQIYMQSVQMLTGSGGWPMSVFMTHDGRPFYGGTYWPPDSRYGRPGFGQVLLAILDAWNNKREELAQQSDQIVQHLQSACRGPAAHAGDLDGNWIARAARWLVEHHDARHGGFGGAPKFPHAMDLSLLVELCADSAQITDSDPNASSAETGVTTSELARVARHTLNKMSGGGIYDHLGGGFARYSVDERWLVPHFEKMLYDNALLASVYADAARLWDDVEYERVVCETLDYVIRDMTNELGGYYSTEDADSEGVEGKFYVWDPAEIRTLLGEQRADRFCEIFDVASTGNFEGANILHLQRPLSEVASSLGIDAGLLRTEIDQDRQLLLAAREKRVRPGLDDKVLLGWNALMISGMVRGYRATAEQRFLDSALGAFQFVRQHLGRPPSGLWHTWREGRPSLAAYLDDYAFWLDALTELFQVHATPEVLEAAIEAADILLEQFRDTDGGFFFTSNHHEQLVARSKDLVDSSIPSGNAMAASGLLNLGRLTERDDYREAAKSALQASSGVMRDSPQAAGQALRVLARWLAPDSETILLLPDEDSHADLRARILKRFEPQTLTLAVSDQQAAQLESSCPLLRHRRSLDGQPTLYVCRDSVCKEPLVGPQVDASLN